MSYILDALRKSEEARRRQQGPDFSLAESPPHAEHGRSSRALPLLALALLVNGAVLGIWLLRSGNPEPTAVETTPRTEAREPAASSGQVMPPSAAPTPAAPLLPTPTPTATRALETPAVSSGIDWRQQPVRRLGDLPAQSRNRFPPLAISTHIYADEAAYREVSINGRRYQEGDRVAGLTLLEITETGVLMGFEEQVIRLDLQDEWDL
ncbi:MAG: general secretion pathway protein GspB [Gammaproteobacteria bacterium]|nr:general secretion pathway protein GspB [Gammaproteobacteria bacterium]